MPIRLEHEVCEATVREFYEILEKDSNTWRIAKEIKYHFEEEHLQRDFEPFFDALVQELPFPRLVFTRHEYSDHAIIRPENGKLFRHLMVFMNNQFPLSTHHSEYPEKTFSELPEDVQNLLWNTKFDYVIFTIPLKLSDEDRKRAMDMIRFK